MICDPDDDALSRTKDSIYPQRYGAWDNEIVLCNPPDAASKPCDLVIIGTPPDSHIPIALDLLNNHKHLPKIILIEKPLCGPGLEGCDELQQLSREKGVLVCVGYNHVLSRITEIATEYICSGCLGDPQTIVVNWVEHWGGIFGAHPWLAGPSDSYLGFSQKGGGACAEHSHGINIWQHFAHLLNAGRISTISSVMDREKNAQVDFDRIVQMNVVTENGLVGYIVQDVVTQPAIKLLRIQGSDGALEWQINKDSSHDSVRLWRDNEWQETLVAKSRPDDFAGEIDHIEKLLQSRAENSPISLQRGLETMMVVSAAHYSAQQMRSLKINYNSRLTPDSFISNL
ncbi:MAG: hypothetical protein DHS20C01_13800 [marine bacterium B5-7]|nr:MAG: hypothetical protein DHS20C01_13800 [marine bacterium B5-7]